MKNFFGFCEDRKETDGAPFISRLFTKSSPFPVTLEAFILSITRVLKSKSAWIFVLPFNVKFPKFILLISLFCISKLILFANTVF